MQNNNAIKMMSKPVLYYTILYYTTIHYSCNRFTNWTESERTSEKGKAQHTEIARALALLNSVSLRFLFCFMDFQLQSAHLNELIIFPVQLHSDRLNHIH